MKNKSFAFALAALSLALLPLSLRADIQFWDPNGSTTGSSVPGNWDLVTSNWAATVDSGINTVWTQGNEADFVVAANYTVTVTQAITVGNITLSGSTGTLTISNTPGNSVALGGSAVFNTGGRGLTILPPITGSFDLTRSGAGTLTLSGASTYAGGTTLSAGTVAVGVDSVSSGGVITSGAFGTGQVNNNAATTLQGTGGAHEVHNPIMLNANLTIAGSTALTFRNGGWTVNGANRTVTVNNTADTTLAGNLADDGSARTLTKAGTGRLIFSGTNSGYLGPITISAGTLTASGDNAIQTHGVLTATGTLDMNGFNGLVVGLAGAGAVTLGSGSLTIANAGSSRQFTGVISGTGSVIVSNTVSQQLQGQNTFSGGLIIQQGTLFLQTNFALGDNVTKAAGSGPITMIGSAPDSVVANVTAALGGNATTGLVIITNAIVLSSGRVLFFPSNGGAVQFAGGVSGAGGFLRSDSGSGLVILSGNSSYSGGLEIDSRSLALANKNAVGTGLLTVGNAISGPANTINLVAAADLSGANAVTNVTTFNQNFTLAASNKFELSGPITLSNAVTVTLPLTNPVTFSGPMNGAFGLTLNGGGTLVLGGSNSYTGDTAVNGGTLVVNNTTGSGTGAGNVSIATGATLGGNGIIAGAVTINSAATVGAGNSAGKLTFLNGLDLSMGGTNTWELAALKDSSNGIAGTDFDQLVLAGGNLALGGSATLTLQFIGSASAPSLGNPFWQTNHAWKIIALTGTAANPGSSNFGALAGTNGISAGTFATSVDGSGNVFLSYVATTPPVRPVIDNNIANAGTTNATIQWSSVAGIAYQVQYKNTLNDTNWSVLGLVTAGGSSASITDTNNPPAPQRYYRVVVQ